MLMMRALSIVALDVDNVGSVNEYMNPESRDDVCERWRLEPICAILAATKRPRGPT
jgi:hypothetical protein